MTKWISVESYLPEKSESIWCAGREEDRWGQPKPRAVVDAVYGDDDIWWSDTGEAIQDVTHWQPNERPDLPEEANIQCPECGRDAELDFVALNICRNCAEMKLWLQKIEAAIRECPITVTEHGFKSLVYTTRLQDILEKIRL